MSQPLLCITLTAPTMAELRQERDAVAEADLVELRLDTVRDPDVASALHGRRRPVIVTCRPVWEGGRFTGSEEERKRILGEAIDLGAEYVDVEWRAGFEDLLARVHGTRIVLSCHDFEGVPADLVARTQAMRATGAAVVKVAVTATQLRDCLPLLELRETAPRESGSAQGLVAIAMGEAGLASRVLACRFGSAWTYAGAERHVGQVSADALVTDYRFRTITGETEVYGLLGNPVSHSVSPAMHNAAFAAAGKDAVYLPFPAASAEDFVVFARAMGLKGASVTTPYKVAMLDHVSEVLPDARRFGAINTIHAGTGRWIGGNTDATAFLQPLTDRGPIAGARVAVLGAGGAARTVAVALTEHGARVRVHARSQRRAEDVATFAGAEAGPWPPPPGTWDVLVNCTPAGMHPHVDETPVPAVHLTGRVVYDLIYNPPTTRLMREAGAAGCTVIGGLEMLVAQAQEQFAWWTGTRPSAEIMRRAAVTHLAGFTHDEHHVI